MPDNKDPLSDFFRLVSEEKAVAEKKEDEFLSKLDVNVSKDLSELFSQIVLADKEERSLVCEIEILPPVLPVVNEEEESIVIEEESLLERSLGILGGTSGEKTSDPLTPLNQEFMTLADFNKHYKTFVERIQQQLSTLGGGGEVEFRYLDDVNRSTMKSNNNNFVLEYDAATKKVQFTNEIGPIDNISFDVNHDPSSHDHAVGTLFWDPKDQTLNLTHPNEVTQQIGQELYGYVRNQTGSLIPNGTVVRFAGAANENGNARLLMTPFTANGDFPSLYTLGVATSDIDNDSNGRVTVWGKVRDINASGSGVVPAETWLVGDVLYAHPTYAGGLTKFKPTSPNNVVPVAAVLSNDATVGELFVRPTIEQRYDYATVSSTVTQSITLGVNTPHKIALNVIVDNRGITIDPVDSSKIVFSQSGLYAIGFNTQILSTNASAKEAYFWIRENGIDEPFSTRTVSTVGNNVYTNFGVSYNVSAQAGEYVQFMWAANDVAVSLKTGPTSAFAPSSPSVYIHIDQAAL